MIKQSCTNCQYAAFVLTPTGRIKAGIVGRCGVEMPTIPEVPECITFPAPYRRGIWPDMGMTCCAWKAKQPQKVPA